MMYWHNVLTILTAGAVGPAKALWPIPASSKAGDTALTIDQTVRVTYNGNQV